MLNAALFLKGAAFIGADGHAAPRLNAQKRRIHFDRCPERNKIKIAKGYFDTTASFCTIEFDRIRVYSVKNQCIVVKVNPS